MSSSPMGSSKRRANPGRGRCASWSCVDGKHIPNDACDTPKPLRAPSGVARRYLGLTAGPDDGPCPLDLPFRKRRRTAPQATESACATSFHRSVLSREYPRAWIGGNPANRRCQDIRRGTGLIAGGHRYRRRVVTARDGYLLSGATPDASYAESSQKEG